MLLSSITINPQHAETINSSGVISSSSKVSISQEIARACCSSAIRKDRHACVSQMIARVAREAYCSFCASTRCNVKRYISSMSDGRVFAVFRNSFLVVQPFKASMCKEAAKNLLYRTSGGDLELGWQKLLTFLLTFP